MDAGEQKSDSPVEETATVEGDSEKSIDDQPYNESEISDMIDAADALKLLAKGESLKGKQRGAMVRLRSRIFQEEAARLKQKDLCSLMGVAQTQLNAIENRYGLPVGSGRTLNLSAILKSVKQFLDDNKAKFEKDAESPEEILKRKKQEIEIAKAEEQIRKIQIGNAKAEGTVVDRAEIEQMLNRLATVLRKLGETVSRRASMSGREVKQMIDASLNSIKNEIAKQDSQ